MAGHLLRKGSIVAAMTFISRILGLLREVAVAALLGAEFSADVFLLAQRIPNLLRRLFAEGAFAQAFVPVLAEYHTRHSREDMQQLLNKVSGTLGGILLGVTVLGMLGSPVVVALMAPSYLHDMQKFQLASSLVRITFPFLLFVSLTAFAGSILNSVGQFAVSALTPALLSICQIFAALAVAPALEQQSYALAWGFFTAGLLQLLVQLPFLWRAGLLPRPQWGWRDPAVQRILKLMTPAMFSVSVSQISMALDAIFVTSLATGSLSWLYYAQRLEEFPLGIFGIAIATVALPSLSRQHAGADSAQFNKTMDWALRILMLIGLPATCALIVLSDGFVATVYLRGKFDAHSALMTSHAMMAYSLGLLSIMMAKVLATGYFARQDMKTPVKFGIQALVFNMICNAVLIWPLQHVGLALATSLSGTLNAVMLYRGLRKAGAYTPEPGWVAWMGKLLTACAVMSAALYWADPVTSDWNTVSSWTRMLWTCELITLGLLAYATVLWLFGVRPRHLKGQV